MISALITDGASSRRYRSFDIGFAVGVILWLLLFIIGKIPLAEPFGQIARVVVYVVGALILISLLLGFVGHPIFNLR